MQTAPLSPLGSLLYQVASDLSSDTPVVRCIQRVAQDETFNREPLKYMQIWESSRSCSQESCAAFEAVSNFLERPCSTPIRLFGLRCTRSMELSAEEARDPKFWVRFYQEVAAKKIALNLLKRKRAGE